MASSPITSRQIEGGKVEAVADFIFLGSRVTENADCSPEIRTLAPWEKSYDKPRQCIKKQRYHFANKGPLSKSYGFSGSHVQMCELDHKEAEHQKIDAFELWCWGTLESPLNRKNIKPINPKGNRL